MPSIFVNEINKPGVTTSPAIDPDLSGALVVAAKAGDELAFEVLVKRNQPRVLALALRYTRVREDAEDIVQQTFQKAFVHLHKFEGKSSFATWLTRIAINEALILLRRGRALREVLVDAHGEAEGSATSWEMADSSPDPETSYMQGEKVQILSETLANLRPGMRKVVELRELAELSTEETARRIGVSVAAVKARLFHARRKLREKLRRYLKSHATHGKNNTGSATTGHFPQHHLCNASGFVRETSC